MATTETRNYSTLCDVCRADGVVSVERTVEPALGCCALCGEPIPAAIAALLKAPGARPCRDCRGVCLPTHPCLCCVTLVEAQALAEQDSECPDCGFPDSHAPNCAMLDFVGVED